jgi:hypothetical protein
VKAIILSIILCKHGPRLLDADARASDTDACREAARLDVSSLRYDWLHFSDSQNVIALAFSNGAVWSPKIKGIIQRGCKLSIM